MGTEPSQTPTPPPPPPAASPLRRAPQPATILSPSFSRNPLRATAASASAGPVPSPSSSSDCEEHPCVELFDWWLKRVEGDDRKVRIAGHTERNHKPHLFTSAPIVKRHKACMLEAEDSIIVLIDGPLDLSQMENNGYSLEVCEKFMTGFPCLWESYNLGSQQSCSYTSISRDGRTKFYLERFQIGNFIDKVGSSFLANLLNNSRSSSGNDADSFEKGSYLSNKKPRFEEYTCDLDISAKEKTTAFNEGSTGSLAVCNKVGNQQIDLVVKSFSKQRGHGNIDLSASLTSIEETTRDKTSEDAGNQNEFIHSDAEYQEAGSHLVNSDSIYGMSTESGNQNEFIHADAEHQEVGSHVVNSDSNFDMSTDNMICEMGDGSANAGSAVSQGSKEVLATVLPERANLSPDSCLDNILPISTCNSNNCLENQGFPEIAQHMTLNEEVVPNEDISTSVHSDVESLGNPVGPAEVQRSECDILQGAPRSPKQHVGSAQEQRPEQSMSQGAARSPMIRTPIPDGAPSLRNQHLGSAQEQRSEHFMLKGATRSPMIRTPIPYGHYSPLTRGKAKSSSVSTPESLKLRRTRSGRVVVPTLDPGCQRIVYDRDGLVSGVAGLEFESPPLKGNESRTPESKRRVR
uniref:SANTA domain-containing protein n=1 Tax=Oryza barthii TaxID=65489 RepID=A0A0D3FUF7_9ORYZ